MNALSLSVILILGFIIIYVILIQIYSVLFRITGMTQEKASFQVISMLTGAGYTTSESEIVTDDRSRRKIAKAAMITGYSFSVIVVSLLISVISNFSKETLQDSMQIIIIAFSVFVLFFVITKLPFIKRPMEILIEKLATKIMARGKNDNIITLLDVYGNDAICEIHIRNLPDFMKHKNLIECKLKVKYSINVLMLKRKNRVIEVGRNTVIQRGDIIVVFGVYQNIKDLFYRTKADTEKVVAVDEKVKENNIELLDNYGDSAMAKIDIYNLPLFMQNRDLIECGLKSDYGINVLMITRKDRVIEVSRDTVIKVGDQIVVFGPYDQIKDVFLYMNYTERKFEQQQISLFDGNEKM